MRCLFDSVLYHCAHPVKSDPRIIMYNNSRSTVSKSMRLVSVLLHLREAQDVSYQLSHKGLQVICLGWGRMSKTCCRHVENLKGIRR